MSEEHVMYETQFADIPNKGIRHIIKLLDRHKIQKIEVTPEGIHFEFLPPSEEFLLPHKEPLLVKRGSPPSK